MDKNTTHLTQLLLDRIVELEKRNATIENILDKVVDRLDDLDGRGIYGWPRPQQVEQDEFVDLEA